MIRMLENGVEVLYCADATEMAKFLRVGVEFSKVIQVAPDSYTVIELSKEEWETITNNAFPEFSLQPCQHAADAQKRHSGYEGGASTTDAQKLHHGGGACGSDASNILVSVFSRSEDQSIDPQHAAGAQKRYSADAQKRHSGGGEGTRNAQERHDKGGAQRSDGINTHASGGSGSKDMSAGQEDRGDESTSGAGDSGGAPRPGDVDDLEEVDDRAFAVRVMVILRGQKAGSGIELNAPIAPIPEGSIAVPLDAGVEPEWIALTPLSKLSMAGSLCFDFKKEKEWDFVEMKVALKGTFENSGGRCVKIGKKFGVLHDDLEIRFFPRHQENAPVVLVNTIHPPHGEVASSNKAQSSNPFTTQNMFGARLQARLGARFSVFRPSGFVEGIYQHTNSSTSMNLEESGSSINRYVVQNTSFLMREIHCPSVGELAIVATHMDPKLSNLKGKEWKTLQPSPPLENDDLFHHSFGLGWPVELQVEGEYRFWGEGIHEYQFKMKRRVGETAKPNTRDGDDGVYKIADCSQVYSPTIKIDHSSSWKDLKISSFLLHHRRKRFRSCAVEVAE